MRSGLQTSAKGVKRHAANVRLFAHPVNGHMAEIGALSALCPIWQHCAMGEGKKPVDNMAVRIVAANLRALQQHGKDQKRRKVAEAAPGNDKALEAATRAPLRAGEPPREGVSRRTIQDMREGTRAVGIDTLHAIAKAYGLHAYQLLLPDLRPENPAVAPSSDTEIAIYRAIHATIEKQKEREKASGVEGGVVGMDSDSPGAGSSQETRNEGTT